MFCHAGHEIEQASQELFINSVCNCGSGDLDECETLNSKSPIEAHKGSKKCKVVRATY